MNKDKGKSPIREKVLKEPDTIIILVVMILFCSVLTYILPAGAFDRVIDPNTSREVVVAGSYHRIERNPISLLEIFKSIPLGLQNAQSIVFFTLIIGGAFKIINATGAIESGLAHVVRGMAGKEALIVPVLMAVFGLAGVSIGIAEEALIFIPMVVPLCLALGFDSITGTAIVLVGAGAGFAGGMLNPYTVGVAHGITGLPMFSGIGFRFIVFAVLITVSIIYVMRYAKKVKLNPTVSLMYDIDRNINIIEKNQDVLNKQQSMTNRQKVILIILLIGIIVIAVGVFKFGFYMVELGAIFLMMGVLSGFIGGLKLNEMADKFVAGAKDLLYAGLVIGIARSVLVVLESGNIIDTVVNGLASLIIGLPPTVSAYLVFIVQSLLSVIIASGSGQAAVTIPIMAPVADLVGITRQTIVLTYQFGDAFSNLLTPTAGYFMAAIAMHNISWKKWAKFFFPLFVIWNIIAIIFITVAVSINYGPF